MTSVLLLRALGVKAEGGHLVLELGEHEKRNILVASSQAGEQFLAVSDLLSGAVEAGLLSLRLTRQKGRASSLQVEAGSAVGFATSSDATGRRVLVRVNPKVGTQRMIELASLAGMLPPWSPGGAYITASLETALLEWTVGAYLNALTTLVRRGGLRSSHERVRADLTNRLKGRLLVGPWLRNVSRAAPHILPSEFPSLRIDNEPNRFLRWGLQVATALARDQLKNDGLRIGLSSLDRHFASVPLHRFPSGSAAVRVLPPSMRHYKAAVEACRYVIDSAKLGNRAGSIEAMSLVLDMNMVYERAFFNGLRSLVAEANRHEVWPIKLRTPGSLTASSLQRTVRMVPDIWMESTEHRLPIVIDTKWKHVLSRVKPDDAVIMGEETKMVQVNSADLYQAMAYGVEVLHKRHSAGRDVLGCVSALVYPTLDDLPDLGCQFNIGEPSLSLAMLGWNVSRAPIEGLREIWSRLKALAERADPEQLVLLEDQ